MKKALSLLLILATTILGPQTMVSAAASPESADEIGYTNSEVRFSLTLPASWAGQYRIISSAASVSFLHRESEEDGSKTGVLFSIIRYDGKSAAKDVVGAGKRYLAAQTNEYSYVLAYPSGVEYTDTSKAGYQKLAADIDKIGKTVFPIINTTDPTYKAFSKFDENGLTDNHIYTFADGSVDAAPGDYLLMLNGEFSDAHVIMKNDRALVPVSVIRQTCGADVLWGYQAGNGDIISYGSNNGSSNLPPIIKIHNKDGSMDIKMTVGQTSADVNGKTEALDTPPVIANNTAYVPLRFVCDCFGKVIGSLPAGQDAGDPKSAKSLAFNPIVWVDDSEKTNAAKPTDATLTWLKAQMNQALTSLKKYRGAILEDTGPNDPAFSQIADDINNTYYVGNVGRYALYQGPYPTLVDVNSKTIYFYTVGSGSGWRIWQANMNDPETFMLYYFAS
ncbi:copper amine oxidase N-terminal domain-containing protein [Caproicibacter sp. BJN0012]|uniref:copper amine oxidase N-terminal domain-containing protein n=1 Tax=Caproicibacter sp. BJN0012 TaxID=3110227 RepID=UPI002E11B4D8